MQDSYSHPKTIDAVKFNGRYVDPKVFQARIKSLASAGVLLGAGFISAILILM